VVLGGVGPSGPRIAIDRQLDQGESPSQIRLVYSPTAVLSWLRRLGGSPDSHSNSCLCGDGKFDYEIVGEASYQNRLRLISAGRRERGEQDVRFPCHLHFEINGHTHMPAIRVDASGGRTVGYFPAEQAEVYAPILQEIEQSGQKAECLGVLVGGHGDRPTFGVWLDFKPSMLHL
jgi:hypothetical protein